MSVTSEQKAIIRKGARAREATPPDSARIRGLDRIEIDVRKGLSYGARALGQRSLMKVDEPPDRGGTGDGNTPMAHFLARAGNCLLNQFIRITIADGYDLQFVKSRVTVEFRRDVGGGFEHVVLEVYAEGELPESDAKRLTPQ